MRVSSIKSFPRFKTIAVDKKRIVLTKWKIISCQELSFCTSVPNFGTSSVKFKTGKIAINEDFIQSLVRYQSHCGNLLVPRLFVDNDLKLGRLVDIFRQRYKKSKLSAADIEKLNHIGFIWDPYRYRFEKIHQALALYKKFEGDLNIPVRFVIPAESNYDSIRWPQDLHGMKLGNIVRDMKRHRHYNSYKSELIALGFSYEGWTSMRVSIISRALRLYLDNYGNLAVPRRFVIANKDDSKQVRPRSATRPEINWPADLHGLKLGEIVNNIRNHGAYKEFDEEFRKEGFVFERLR